MHRRWAIVVLSIAFVVMGAETGGILTIARRVNADFGTLPISTQLNRFFSHELVAGEREGRINVLLLGISGQGEPAPPLAETLALLSIYPALQGALLLSIPPELAVVFPDGSLRKLREAYRWGQEVGTGGREESRRIVSEAIGVPLHYVAAIDFGGVSHVIDDLGGISIDVQRFDTHDPNIRYCPPLHRRPRWVDGAAAVQFVLGPVLSDHEGADFTRSKRQRGLLLGLRDRLRSGYSSLTPWTILRFADDISRCVDTDLEPWEMAALERLLEAMTFKQLPSVTVDDVVEWIYEGDGTPPRLRPRGGPEPLRFRVRNLTSRPALIDLQRIRPSECAKAGGVLSPPERQPQIVPRSVWDRRRYVPAIVPHQHVRGIVIHHDGFRNDRETGEKKVRTLHEILVHEGALDVPYHYLIDRDGRIFEGAPEWTVAHMREWHDPANLLHIALMGDYESDLPSETQLFSLVDLVEWKAVEYGLTAAQISLHRDLTVSDCPGRHAYDVLTAAPWCRPAQPASDPSPF